MSTALESLRCSNEHLEESQLVKAALFRLLMLRGK